MNVQEKKEFCLVLSVSVYKNNEWTMKKIKENKIKNFTCGYKIIH
jgi:hypothetical protein